MEAAIQQYHVDKQYFKIQKKSFLIENDRLLDQIMSQDIVNIVVNSLMDKNNSMNVNSSVAMNDSVNYVEMCNKCLELEAKLIKQHNMVEKDEYNRLSKSFSKLEQHCISLELAMKIKGKDIVDNAAQVSKASTIAPGMYKLDPVTLVLTDKNNKETHIYYLKHTMQQAAILREIVEQAKSLNPLDSASYSAYKIDQGVGSTSGIRACALRNFDLGKMELENSQNNALAKLPMLKLGEYEMWEIRIKQYFQIQDYALWEVIEDVGNHEEIQEKASTETELFIQEVTPTEVIQDQEGSGKASDEVSTAGAKKGTASEEVPTVST
ncbi:hypothetical protein Tco_1399585, partial [Tanacetum coccineum]